MIRFLASIPLALLLCLGSDAQEARQPKPLPPGYVYPELPPEYEGKRICDLGPITSIQQVDPKLEPETGKPIEWLPNEFITKALFERRLAHVGSFPMPGSNFPNRKLLEVTLADGTRLWVGPYRSFIEPPGGKSMPCILLKDQHYYENRVPDLVKPNGEQGGAGEPATRAESDSVGSDNPKPESEGRSR